MTDFNMKISRGGFLDAESLKSLFDIIEGGAIQDTRYRPALFPPGLPRIIAVNESEETVGNLFQQ